MKKVGMWTKHSSMKQPHLKKDSNNIAELREKVRRHQRRWLLSI